MKTQIKSLSQREVKVVSYLELEGKRFFTKPEIKHFFRTKASADFFIGKLMRKRRIEKISNTKYYLIPIQAYRGWAEHPFIVADEIFSGKDYSIGGKAACHFWGMIDQLPTVIDVFSTKKQGMKNILGSVFKFRRVRKLPKAVRRKIKDHSFLIAEKKVCKKWI